MGKSIPECYMSANAFDFEIFNFTQLDRSFPPHFHSTLMAGSLLEGSRHFFTPGQSFTLEPGQIIIVPPYVPHSCQQTSSSRSCSWFCLHINPECLHGDLKTISEPVVLGDPGIWALWLRLKDMKDHAHLGRQIALILASINIIRNENPKKSACDPICDYMRRNYQRSISLEDLAAFANMSRFTLERVFKSHKGITPYKYLESLRIDHARNMLKNGMNLCECALWSGYCDQSHISRAFKAFMGLPPGLWLKRCCLQEPS